MGWDYSVNPYWGKNPDLLSILFPREKFKYTKKPKVRFYKHHYAHAASSFLFSGFERSVIMVLDGQGEQESISLGYGYNNNDKRRIKLTKAYPVNLSLGYMYDKIGEYIGLGHWAAGKMMGLAPYGKKCFKFPVVFKNNGEFEIKGLEKFKVGRGELDDEDQMGELWEQVLVKEFGGEKKFCSRPSSKVKDIARTGQIYFEKISEHILKAYLKNCKNYNNLCLAGGAALNCVNNSKLIERFKFEKAFIQPASNDAGISLGAAALILNEKGIIFPELKNTYYGPEYSDKEVRIACSKFRLRLEKIDNIEKFASRQLEKNKILAWFQGRMEFGPRALGNRSILANPLYSINHRRLNHIKRREPWRPFSPIILHEDLNTYILNARDSRFMLETFIVKERYRTLLSVINHVDNTTRPQIVHKEGNKRLYRLLKEFKARTGLGILVNTSFNTRKNAPIVSSPRDAIRNFIGTNIDYLIINNFVIKNEKTN